MHVCGGNFKHISEVITFAPLEGKNYHHINAYFALTSKGMNKLSMIEKIPQVYSVKMLFSFFWKNNYFGTFFTKLFKNDHLYPPPPYPILLASSNNFLSAIASNFK